MCSSTPMPLLRRTCTGRKQNQGQLRRCSHQGYAPGRDHPGGQEATRRTSSAGNRNRAEEAGPGPHDKEGVAAQPGALPCEQQRHRQTSRKESPNCNNTTHAALNRDVDVDAIVRVGKKPLTAPLTPTPTPSTGQRKQSQTLRTERERRLRERPRKPGTGPSVGKISRKQRGQPGDQVLWPQGEPQLQRPGEQR